MRKLLAILPIVGLLVFGFGLTAQAHSFTGEGDCDNWYLQLDGTWNAYDITVDGTSIGLEQNPTFADSSDSTSRTFVVRWWKQGPDVERTVTVERTLDCEEETTTTLPEDTTTTTEQPSSTTTTQPETTSSTTSSSLPETTTTTSTPITTTTLPAETTTVPAPPTTDVCESEGTVPDSCLPPSTSPGPTLPNTGPNDGLGLAVSAFALLVLGGMVVLEGRR